jgi:2-phospho-L-lactate transferase/gluconeogenesis factor (CofD/UPF0052 family)
MLITIFSGGSGSLEIQRGLYKIFGDTVEQRIIINGYDDGKSTGAVRRLYDNTILGPSDLRKNQVFRHQLQNGDQETELSRFLNHRFDAPDVGTAKNIVLSFLQVLKELSSGTYQLFYNHIELFFAHPSITEVEFTDFNIGNIIYSSLFAELGIADAISVMEKVLGIPSGHVLYQSNEALNLSATTSLGNTLPDEVSIVEFSDPNDEIIAVHLQKIPTLLDEVVEIVKRSDMIIFSCGTLWSSHIPTFISEGFYDLIKNVKCDKYIIVNLVPDKDVLGVSDNGYVRLFKHYLPLGDGDNSTVMVYTNGGRVRPPQNLKYPHLVIGGCDIISKCGRKHNGTLLCLNLLRHHYRRICKYTHHIFDYDYTLYVPGQEEFNEEIFSIWDTYRKRKSILTRNDIRHVRSQYYTHDLYAQFGVWHYQTNQYMDPSLLLLPEEKTIIYEILSEHCGNTIKIEDRDITICAKPVPQDYRNELATTLTEKWVQEQLKCIPTGRTSIEVMKTILHKNLGYQWVQQNNPNESTFYISDEDDIPELHDEHKWIIGQEEQQSLLAYLKWHHFYWVNKKCIMPDLFIVAGGRNTRNEGNIKLLAPIGNTCVLDQILKNASDYVRHIYILTTCKDHQEKLNAWLSSNSDTDSDFVSVICSWDGPTTGSLETLYYGLLQVGIDNCSTQSLVMWSDCILPDARLVCELSHMYGNFIVPTEYIRNPYAYVVEDSIIPGVVKEIKLRSDVEVKYGYHDLSIFNLQLHTALPVMADVSNLQHTIREPSLFDIIPYLNCTFYESQYPTYSFNSRAELEMIQKQMM